MALRLGIAGKGMANPTALLLFSILMLDHIGERPAARRIEAALEKIYREAAHTTKDVGGKALWISPQRPPPH